jgi:hypothetical protein
MILNLPDNFDFSPERNKGQVINGLNACAFKMGSTAVNREVAHAVYFQPRMALISRIFGVTWSYSWQEKGNFVLL